MIPGMERFSKDLHEMLKTEYVLWKWVVGVSLDRECVEFVIAGLYKIKFYDFMI